MDDPVEEERGRPNVYTTHNHVLIDNSYASCYLGLFDGINWRVKCILAPDIAIYYNFYKVY